MLFFPFSQRSLAFGSIWWLDSPALTPIFQFLSVVLGQSGQNVVIILQAKSLEKETCSSSSSSTLQYPCWSLTWNPVSRVLCFSLCVQLMRPHLSYSFDYIPSLNHPAILYRTQLVVPQNHLGCNHSTYIWRKYMGHESCVPLSLDLWVINHTTIGPLPQIHHKLLR